MRDKLTVTIHVIQRALQHPSISHTCFFYTINLCKILSLLPLSNYYKNKKNLQSAKGPRYEFSATVFVMGKKVNYSFSNRVAKIADIWSISL